MSKSNSKEPQDFTDLFASCAKGWASCDVEEQDHPQNANATPSKKEKQEKSQKPKKEKGLEKKQQKANILTFFSHDDTSLSFNTQLSALRTAQAKAKPVLTSDCDKKVHELLIKPENACNWHIYLQSPQKNQDSLSLSDIFKTEDDSFLQANETPSTDKYFQKQEEWLKEGMQMGVLRHTNLEEFATPITKAYLPQDLFWQRFLSACEYTKGRVSLILFEIPKCDKDTQKACVLELIEQILSARKDGDFFGEINDFGIALAMPNHGSFAATACAERIMTRFEAMIQKSLVNTPLHKEYSLGSEQIHLGIAEREEGENADTLFANAKEALFLYKKKSSFEEKMPCCLFEINVFSHAKKAKEKNSLVQSDEKRFLFFGTQ